MTRVTLIVTLLVCIVAAACSGSSVEPEIEAYFTELEAVYATYDARKDELVDEFTALLPLATSAEELENISREGSRAIVEATIAFENELDALEPPPPVVTLHVALLESAGDLQRAYAEELRRLEAGAVSADPIERGREQANIAGAVDALAAKCRSLQEFADDEVNVDLVCN